MCGICGVVSSDSSEPIDPRVIGRMRDSLAHRGPDDKGYYIGPGVGLGHRRLSIIDLRPEGRQPMANEDGSVKIVFNGEIYNFADHYQLLLARGHRFRSRSDTEVIIHLYEEFGVECLKLLRGMFAFAIWDERKRSLFLARDRLGKKPLYYYFDGKRLIFGSEAKAVLAYPGIKREPDLNALDSYISFGYVPGLQSAFKGVCKLPPAHYLVFTDGTMEIRRYWQVHYLPKLEITEREACAQIVERLTEAVKLRMIADVPLGAFLSGGVDSSAVVAIMAKLSSAPVKTFSIGFKEPEFDETEYANVIARKFETEHHRFTVEPDATEVLEKLVWHYDEPYADSSALPTYYLSKMTREYVTVALNGDAGDENFGGYQRYLLTLMLQHMHMLPATLRTAIAATAAGAGFFLKGRTARGLGTLAEVLRKDPKLMYARLMTPFSADARRGLYSRDFADNISGDAAEQLILSLYKSTDAQDIVDGTLSVDLNLYLPYDLLVKVDVASMAVGLEARSPMVDHEFIEFVARLPARFKISGLTLKAIFKKALRGILPDSTLKRSKMGFGVPLEHWFRGELSDLIRDTLLSDRCLNRGYFKPAFIEELIAEHLAGRRNNQSRLWNLLMLELWHRVHIDAPVASKQSHADALSTTAL
jgi:asparagine synthase (glutamine-hydrolysing)